jgi:hypothetical protein
MARRSSKKRTRNEKIWIVIGVLVAVSMVLASVLSAVAG